MAEEEPGTAAEMSSPMGETPGPGNSFLKFTLFGFVDPDPKLSGQGWFRENHSGTKTDSTYLTKNPFFC